MVAQPNNRVRVTNPALWVTGEGAPDFIPSQYEFSAEEDESYMNPEYTFDNLYAKKKWRPHSKKVNTCSLKVFADICILSFKAFNTNSSIVFQSKPEQAVFTTNLTCTPGLTHLQIYVLSNRNNALSDWINKWHV